MKFLRQNPMDLERNMVDARMQKVFYGRVGNLEVTIKENSRKKFLVDFYQQAEGNESVFGVLLIV